MHFGTCFAVFTHFPLSLSSNFQCLNSLSLSPHLLTNGLASSESGLLATTAFLKELTALPPT